jgi:rRNA maturation RNase YbeY
VAISFSSIDSSYVLKNKRLVKSWIKNCIESNNFTVGEINIVFSSDSYILEVNNQFLGHNYFTDIITFPYSSSSLIDADIVISIDTVKSNSIKFNQPFNRELHRVIIHGILHLTGFNDKSNEQKQQMRVEEEKWLSNFNL